MSAWIKPGAKCVCVRKGAWISPATMTATDFGPRDGEVLTIAEVVPTAHYGLQLHFAEYQGRPDGLPPAYPAGSFRPLVSQAEDVALFAQLLTGTNAPVELEPEAGR